MPVLPIVGFRWYTGEYPLDGCLLPQSMLRLEVTGASQRMADEDLVMSIALSAMLCQTSDVCGGRMRINGTRITVHRIATLYKQGQTPEEIVQTYPQLSLAQVYSALAYYHANHAEVESELAAADALYDELQRQCEPSVTHFPVKSRAESCGSSM
jgi:uncharacterized protein (DUF433 family)